MNRGGKYFWGIVLVALGAMMILNQLNLFSFSWLWSFSAPVILFVIAFFFVAGFLSKGPSAAGLLVPAGVLGGVGATLLLGSTFHLMPYVWPGFILAPAFGLLLLYLFSNEHSPGLLVPIGILATVAATCSLSAMFGIWHILWPGFIASPAIGLLLLYLFGERQNRGLLIPVAILGGIACMSFFGTFMMGNYGYGKIGLAVILILVGLLSIFRKPGEGMHFRRMHRGNAHADRNANGANGAGAHPAGEADPNLSWDEARSRQQWREYGQQAYREYDEKFNNPDWAKVNSNGNGQKPVNPYDNSNFGHTNGDGK